MRAGDYIMTYTGIRFWPLDPRVEEIHEGDIAHALSLLCRANGHVPHFYSVGQHSVFCAREAKERGYSKRIQLACLLHDGSEAYLSDVTRPVKRHLSEYLTIEEGKIVEARIILDLLDVMRQAGFRFIPSLAPEIIVPGPASFDGNLLYETDDQVSAKALQLVEDMIFKGLRKAASGLEKQGLHAFWADDFMWYGPAGIGSTKGIQGFKDYHQAPFLKALPDRVGGHNHAARFGDGNYICSTGWPSVEATHTGAGWLGIPAPNKRISMRVMDWWRSDGELLVENWVFIDIIEYLLQLDIDIFDRMRKRQYMI